jgi:uncharacterized 2Fe-2S/4Fe-4S cluster protein (DUF4445 family)
MADRGRTGVREPVQIELRPLGRTVEVEAGTPLRDVLYLYGVEFPCGGRGRCRRCRVQVVGGSLPPTPDEEAILSQRDLGDGWRLACRSTARAPVALQVEQFQAPILVDRSPFEFEPRPGFAVAVDLGTTTLVAQLLDLQTGRVLAVQTGLNPQAAYGSDVMVRTQMALEEAGREKLAALIRREVGDLVRRAVATAELGEGALETVVLVGNTVMHHLFCGLDVEPLSHFPFETPGGGLQEFAAAQLGWEVCGDPVVRFLPCLGGFVGSDVLAGVLATRLHESDALAILVDLGTNGEIVVGCGERILCASTAAGPAFEAGGIHRGMQATAGAIDEVTAVNGELRCRVLGDAAPRGICGSGLVDAVAAGLDLGRIEPSGRLAGGRRDLELCGPVVLTQRDIRQLQLAKAAIAAGIRILLDRWGADPADVSHVYLAGAFGNYVSRTSARRIGLIAFPEERVDAVGNTALLGAKLSLSGRDRQAYAFSELRRRIEHLSLAADPSFQELFVEETGFPARPSGR